MNRLTKKSNSIIKEIEYQLIDEKENLSANDGIKKIPVLATNKLGQLEDIEELCEKIVSQPIYKKYVDNGEIHIEDYTEYQALYNFKERRIELYGYEFINWFEIDKYGKTWALTKGELENDSN